LLQGRAIRLSDAFHPHSRRLEGFIRATGEAPGTTGLPPAEMEPDMDAVMANLEAYGAEILG
jgi:hypothetical protein